MALKGTLDDFTIVELIQFPYAGRKTGQLAIAGSGDRSAMLFYSEGKVIHATSGDQEGFEVVVDLVGWEKGEFEFRQGVEADRTTIDMELHQLLMQALKTRDERRFEEEHRRLVSDEATPAITLPADELKAQLEKMAQADSSIEYTCIITSGNDLIAEAKHSAGDGENYRKLRESLAALIGSYTRPTLRRVMIDDDLGSVVLASLGDDRALIVVIPDTSGQSMGAVSLKVSKMIGELTGM